MSVINTQPLIGASGQGGGYNIARSLRLRRSASANLSRTPASAGNRKTWTASFWMKRGEIVNNYSLFTTYTNTDNSVGIFIGESLEVSFYETSRIGWVVSNAVFRDTSAWYHVVVAVDTTQATASNRIKAFINGSQLTSLSQAIYPSQNADLLMNSANQHRIGMQNYPGYPHYFDGYLSEFNFIDGQGLTPSSFGETDTITGVWKPKKYLGTYGTNGFYLPFTDIATTSGSNAGLGKDFSGNGNYWTTNNISVTAGSTYDSMTDVPTFTSTTAANYAVANPLNKQSDVVVSDGNLKISLGSVTGAIRKTNASIALPTTGKYYWETKNVGTTNTNIFCGIQALTASLSASATGDIFYNEAGEIQNNGSSSGTIYGALTSGDILGIAYDSDANKIYFYKNNTLQNSSGTTPSFSGPYIPFFGMYLTNNGQEINFGQRPFAYTPPTGYKALNTYNLPDSAIKAGNKVFDATLYTGNGSTQTITNAASFKPDLVWIKSRSDISNHELANSIVGVQKYLRSNSTAAEISDVNSLQSFNSNGFSIGIDGDINGAGKTMVGWQWQAGQGTNVTNTSGSITSTVSANPSAGFSICTFTSQASGTGTFGHGLGVAPSLVILKNRTDGTGYWIVYHVSTGNTGYLSLQRTDAFSTGSTIFNNTSPSSSVVTLGTSYAGSQSTIAYCWAEVAGFSKIGSFTGNGSNDGPFVYTGFRPKYIMIKNADVVQGWNIQDTSRSPSNLVSAYLSAQDVATEDLRVYANLDILSNGFKLRNSDSFANGSGNKMIYIAFAENPFKNSLAR